MHATKVKMMCYVNAMKMFLCENRSVPLVIICKLMYCIGPHTKPPNIFILCLLPFHLNVQ